MGGIQRNGIINQRKENFKRKKYPAVTDAAEKSYKQNTGEVIIGLIELGGL